jgi:hypothetical protein
VQLFIGLSIVLVLSACLQNTRNLTEADEQELRQYRNMLIEQAKAGKLRITSTCGTNGWRVLFGEWLVLQM